MTNTHTPAPAPNPAEACPTSGRTAAWCTDQSHLTCGTPAGSHLFARPGDVVGPGFKAATRRGTK